MTNQSPSPFAQNDDEAKQKFDIYKSQDPFPDIPPALLNSADVYDYVAATGMIFPFDPNPKKLKPASYEVPILGKFVYWDEEGNPQDGDLEDQNDKFTLKKNSIAFVTLEPMFRLPDYIALRFNLKITNVYRGLLLGTGPLVDPGFVGKLSIPLHNLTNNDYEFEGGEGLIWMEFTKLSPIPKWIQQNNPNPSSRQGTYIEFRKSSMDVDGYLNKAAPRLSIRSSLPEVILNAKQSAEKAQQSAEEAQQSAKESAQKAEDAVKTAESIRNRTTISIAVGGFLTAIATGVALYFTINALTHQLNSLVQDSVNYVNNAKDLVNQSQNKMKDLEQENQRLTQENKRLNQAIEEVKKK
jgi:deoxycytidine triphosphate deaminase